MIKRIFVICLAALLCVPCLGVLASAATVYEFSSSVDNEGMPMLPVVVPEGNYFLSGTGSLNGISFSVENQPVTVAYADADGMLMSVSFISVVVDGQSLFLVIGQVSGNSIFVLGCDAYGPAFGTFSLSGEASEPEPVYSWISGQGFSGYRFPPAGVYNVRVTYAGQVVESVVEVVEVSANSIETLFFPRFDVMPEGSNFYEGSMYDIIYDIIGHEYVSNYSGDQQYVYYICCVMIPLLTVVFVDAVRSVFRGFMGRRK